MRYEINYDPDPINPRTEYDNAGRMLCWHRRYRLGDEQPDCTPDEWLREFAGKLVNADYPEDIPDEHIGRILDKHALILPLYLYDHSGITMSTSPFRCPWDSGQVGFIYMTRKKIEEEFDGDWARAEECLRGEVAEYDAYLCGEIYEYVIYDDDDEIVDSCCGFDDPSYAEAEARKAIEAVGQQG